MLAPFYAMQYKDSPLVASNSYVVLSFDFYEDNNFGEAVNLDILRYN